jgi:lipoyl(octanoyl) transferase
MIEHVQELWTVNLGLLGHREATALQQRVCAARQEDRVPDVLLLLEHPPVYTRGRRSVDGELSMGEDWYRAKGIDVVQVDRGGRVTYHGPGQLVGYPIMRTDDVVRFVRTMEEAIATALADEGLETRLRTDEGPDYTGVWTGPRKIASIGVHVARGVTTHGFAVNVENDLAPFGWVVACGLPDVAMTSLAAETGRSPALLPCFRKRMAHRFAEAHGLRQRLVSRARLEQALDRTAVSAV